MKNRNVNRYQQYLPVDNEAVLKGNSGSVVQWLELLRTEPSVHCAAGSKPPDEICKLYGNC